MASDLLTVFFASALIAGLPILLAALGEQAAERTGVINVGLEGMMVAGAFAGFFAVWLTGSVWGGFLGGVGGGGGAVLGRGSTPLSRACGPDAAGRLTGPRHRLS